MLRVHWAPLLPVSTDFSSEHALSPSASLDAWRVADLVEPGSRVLFVHAIPTVSELEALRARGCLVTTVTGVAGRVDASSAGVDRVIDGALGWPRVREALGAARFEVAILPVSVADEWRELGDGLQSVLPFLSPAGFVIVAVAGAEPSVREPIEAEVLAAGLVVGFAATRMSPADGEPAFVVMAFPLPALDIAAFREHVRRVERRSAEAEHQVRRLGLQVRHADAQLDATRRHASRLDDSLVEMREQAAAQQHALARAEAEAMRLRTDADALRRRVHVADGALMSCQAELEQSRAEVKRAHDELEGLQARCADAAAQMDVLRRSFSWRLTSPIRALARMFGRTTTDRALGWRE